MRKIEKRARAEWAAAMRRGGPVAALARLHLGPAIAAMDKTKAEMEAARAAEEASWSRVLAEKAKADQLIARIYDEMARAGSN